MIQDAPAKARPGEFPLGSIKSRAAARRLLENQRSADDWKTVTVHFESVECAKELARLFGQRGIRLIDAETGKEISLD
jgi:hypothetical protein